MQSHTQNKKIYTLIAHLTESKLQTDNLQFGFKNGLGRLRRCYFTFGNVVDYFTCNSSTVYAALDISKAFDKVSH